MKRGLRNKWEILRIQYIGKRNQNNGRQEKSFPTPKKKKKKKRKKKENVVYTNFKDIIVDYFEKF